MSDIARLEGRAFAAFMFDMDGTILTSIAAAERVWARWALSHGLDVASFLPTIHGKRASDTIGQLGLPGVDPQVEALAIAEAEILDIGGIEPIPGAVEFLAGLPGDRWAIVTSAPRRLAEVRLQAAGIALPAVMIAGEDVSRGKPAPDGYRMAAERLGHRVEECLVFEDAPAGIAAGEASGATVAVITATHLQPMETRHALIPGYAGLTTSSDAQGIVIAAAR